MDPPSVPAEGRGEAVAVWTMELGGTLALRSSMGAVVYPNRKTAGLLAWLAVSGPTPRERLAELFWPAASDPRNSLRFALHVLRRTAPVVTGGDPAALVAGIEVVQGDNALLASSDYTDLPEFDEWLAYQQERRREDRLDVLAERIDALESLGQHVEALTAARQALALDDLSEVACRRVMRLAYLTGDRAGALDAFQRFEERLARELGIRPLPETTALARDVERSTVDRTTQVRRTIPAAVDRPPVLAGRETEWERMEDAWSRGQVIYLSGPPGVGKTRLMHEFAASKVPRPRWNVFTARPGDMTAPYASQARAFRAVLDGCPGIELTPVMRRELSRLLPDLADEAPPPMTTLAEKNYFYATLAEVLILSGAWLDCWIADDWQFVDPPSLEMANYMFANVTPVATERKGQRAICTFRTAEVGDAFHAFLADLVRGGIAVHVELPPLEAPAVGRMLASTGIEGAQALAEPMHRFTGGNPLFVVETLKSLLESDDGRLEESSLRRTWPARVAEVFEERFRRLEARELLLLRLLAVAQTDATQDVATLALQMDDERVTAARAALEHARLIDGMAFGHDLVYEAVARGTPPAVRAHLHRRVAIALTQLQGPAARIAYHHEQAGDLHRALPHFLHAAEDALVRGAFDAAAAWFDKVRHHDDDPDRRARAHRGWATVAPLLEET